MLDKNPIAALLVPFNWTLIKGSVSLEFVLFNINELDYDQYMELAMSEAEFTKFQLQMYTDVRKKLFLMLKFANVRFANYMKVLEEVNSTLDANYGGA